MDGKARRCGRLSKFATAEDVRLQSKALAQGRKVINLIQQLANHLFMRIALRAYA